MEKLGDLSEDSLIERVLAGFAGSPELVVGPGDDCAVIDEGGNTLRLLKTDAILEGIHFLPDEDPEKVGWKAVARVISDFAAMGGIPKYLLITIALDPEKSVAWLDGLYKGIRRCMETHGGILAGGETSRLSQGAIISVAGEGQVIRDQLVLRSQGKPGDLILVTGLLGGSIQGKHLTFTPRQQEALWLATHMKPSAMMDLSDGLAKDLPRLAKASNCGFRIDAHLLPLTPGCTPAQALGDGEDYELLLTVPVELWLGAREQWLTAFPELPLTCIGELVPHAKGQVLKGGWDHFQPQK